ncbi:MAG: GlsB/YeaQ/YmgE family stress response membrane protein [Hyphomicrobium sp.]|uniref:GlsB/YeaQ/YmgE family stress response membrane protein n=1 Tax=Hyphomicrobium sp. TaxID=82 RepID=UPI001329319D|nr:GlsB/YeaQ/YmgE family stress response membrane protein [Hyphomicrobium sp.]KAB2939301.1 MAG: GlsB/YeaQ/YmgE family stress response membrane protein [Hyphomicrobium sp.]MBZ0211228.1 GlsB/YeaQ/YmgE family stress response membrane protein [Hyphomicrobium sp.]
MVITWAQIIVWLIVGLIGGTLAGAVVRWQREGFGWWTNLGIGLVGALVGGLLFHLFGILPGLDSIAVSLRDVVSAVIGSMLFLGALWLWHQRGGGV